MKKRELIAENKRLKLELEQSRNSHHLELNTNDRRLIRLGLIPDRYITSPEFICLFDIDAPVIDWHRVNQDLEDRATYEAAERGRKIAETGDDK